ncbi:uncharacterized protein N7518_003758 [Penicillium psychrosexuale]|uniref:uncharacterized protein n=1 Tax=Penicillium psychrosexuale TaxID=1002107 RepID=UPI002545126F|nr:uncharacterized protein N7518_003758 [Penicillium psychrosexuale]KAJ5801690.1 hypothetical protein N7518_003758 [Penicillium psychrosexuale]
MLHQALATEQDFTTRLDAERSLAYAAMAMKHYYDKTHLHKWFDVGQYVYLRLGHGYDIQANQNLPTCPPSYISMRPLFGISGPPDSLELGQVRMDYLSKRLINRYASYLHDYTQHEKNPYGGKKRGKT